ncbi:unnamed protein product [Lactuca virosa]|uniref:HECT-type E3 ubiquitin transferase n=1 Tax=Lactuca virosa TaxID=75947 RepID=A0AAU9NRT8_9ASTR|nr:unnamed protein product [Lactuca virosa]
MSNQIPLTSSLASLSIRLHSSLTYRFPASTVQSSIVSSDLLVFYKGLKFKTATIISSRISVPIVVEDDKAALASEHFLRNRALEVKIATPKEEMRAPSKKVTRIFVARFPPLVIEDEYRSHFDKFGEITDLYMPKDPSTKGIVELVSLLLQLLETIDHLLYPNPGSGMIHEQHLQFFHFLGIILGKAMFEGMLVDIPFATFLLSKLKQKGVSCGC